jgi:putative membrane protein
MTPRTFHLLSAAALALVAAGAQAQTVAANEPAAAPAKSLSHKDSSFLKDVAEANNAEVAASKIAIAQSSNADVKSFAQAMIDDHSKAEDALTTLAAQKGVKVSDTPSMTQQAEIKMLSERKGASFDQHYAQSVGVKAHQDTIKTFQKEADKGDDADVKAWASKMLPDLQRHLAMAQDLKSKTDTESK